jgi:hypothetical protein
MRNFLKFFVAAAVVQAILLAFINSTGLGDRLAYLFYVLPMILIWSGISGQKINISPLQLYFLPVVLYSVFFGVIMCLIIRFGPSRSQ